VARHEQSANQRAKVIAAGRAAASWVRARRAAWATEPLPLPQVSRAHAVEAPVPTPSPSEPATPISDRLASASNLLKTPLEKAKTVVSAEAAERVSSAPADLAPSIAGPSIWSRLLQAPVAIARNLRDPLVRWVPRLLFAAVIVGVGTVGVRYAPGLLKTLAEHVPTSSTPQPSAAPPKSRATGVLKIASTPEGARILLDGVDRGNTPLEIADVAPGKHVVTLESNVGTVQRAVTVAAGLTAEVNESIFAGFLTVYSPFELSVTEGSHAFRPDDRNEIMLPSGHHELKLSNRALGFEETRSVDLTPGQRLTISVTPPQSTLSVTASEPAEVWLDNFKLGETPLSDNPVTLGTHDLVVRRAAGGERRLTITVTMKPYSIFVDFSKSD
jgi:hypothetical protein